MHIFASQKTEQRRNNVFVDRVNHLPAEPALDQDASLCHLQKVK
jgi:hypothetical protein